MNLIDMYSSKVNSPVTTLTSSLTSVAAGTIETVDIADTSSLPVAPGIATIGVGPTAETIKYTDITGSTLTIERGFEGPTGNWTSGTPIGRFFTSYDYESLKGNIENLNSEINAPAYSSIATTKLAVTPFTVGTLDAPMKYQMEGVSVANSVVNNDFSDGTTGYTDFGGSISISNNIIDFTSDSTGNNGFYSDEVKASSNDKIFVYSKVKNDDGLSAVLRIGGDDTTTSIKDIPITTSTEYQEVYDILDSTYTSTISTGITLYFRFTFTAIGQTFKVDGNAGVYGINMTQYGIENFTETQMLDLVHAMQAGTDIQSAIVDIKVVGKNLANSGDLKSVANRVPATFNGDTITVDNSSNISDRAEARFRVYLENGKTYNSILSEENIEFGSGILLGFIQETGETGSLGYDALNTTFTFSEISGYYDISFITDSGQKEVVNIKVLIEEDKGQTLGVYEPYKQNLLAPQIELKSLPNGVKDELSNAVVDPADSNKLLRLDKAVHTKNIGRYVLQATDFDRLYTGTAVNNLVETVDNILPGAIEFSPTSNLGSVLVAGYPHTSQLDRETAEANHTVNTTSGQGVNFVVTKGTYTDLADAQADLAGTVVYYQLAEAVVTELDIDEMYSFEDGVLYQNGIPTSIDYTTATNQGAVLKEMGSTVEKIDDEVVKKANETMISNSFHADPQKYYGNVKTIDDFQDVSEWTETIGTLSSITDSLIGEKAIRITEVGDVAKGLYAHKNNTTLDLSKTQSGEVSGENDFIIVAVRPSDASKVQAFSFGFGTDNLFAFSNTKYVSGLTPTLTSGKWTIIKIKKSDFDTNGAGSWDEIQSVRVRWDSTINANGEYVDFQLLQLVKKDPLADYPNPFQVNGVREIDIDGNDWFIGEEFGKIGFKNLSNNQTATGGDRGLVFEKEYTDFIANFMVESSANTYVGFFGWEIDDTNIITCRIASDSFQIRDIVDSVATIVYDEPFSINKGEILNSTIIKKGNEVVVEWSKNGGDKQSFAFTTQLDGSAKGHLNKGVLSVTNDIVYSMSITEVSHAHHSDIAEVAKSLTEQPSVKAERNATQAIANNDITKVVLDNILFDTRKFFDVNEPTRLTCRESGLYMIYSTAQIDANSAGDRAMYIYKNNFLEESIQLSPVEIRAISMNISAFLKLEKDDYVEFSVRQTSGSALNLSAFTCGILKVGE